MTNYDSDKSIRLQILAEFGGDTTKHYDSTYSVDLELLNIIQGGGIAGQVIDDQNASTGTTYSSSKLLELLADAGFDTSIAQELPASGDPHTLYFIPSSNPETQNSYDEYLYVGNTWEQVGSTAIDLSNYATLDDISTFLEPDDVSIYATKDYVDSSLANKADASELVNYATKNDISTFITENDASVYLTSSDLNGYATEAFVNSSLGNYYTKAEVDSSLALKADKTYVDSSLNNKVNTSEMVNYATKNDISTFITADEIPSDYVIADADASAGTYSNDIAAFYNKTISENIVQGVQIKVVNEHVVNNASVYSDSYYLPSSSRIYSGNVELWLMTTEDGATWENIHYLITDSTVSRDVSTGSFGPAANA